MLRLLPLTLWVAGTLASDQVVLAPASGVSRFSTCPTDPPVSCPPSKTEVDRCCTNSPGGQLLLTQFWDAAPTYGPVDSWTVHGLWPDRCDGAYEADCDPKRAYRNISAILTAGGGSEVLKDMSIYWKDYQSHDEQFWYHEWSKHGTCISTLEPHCYGQDYNAQGEVVDFFNVTMRAFHRAPLYDWLTAEGIRPSRTASYTLDQLQDAVKKHNGGHEAVFNCQRGWLNEIWLFYYSRGPVQLGEFIAQGTGGKTGSCPATNIRWLPKSAPGDPPPPRPTGAPSGKVFIDVLPESIGGYPAGVLISSGKWMRGVTPAGFTSIRNSDGKGFSLSTSKGPCAITRAGSFICQGGQTATTFTADKDRNILYRSKSTFSAASIPSGPKQVIVVAGGAGRQKVKLRLSE